MLFSPVNLMKGIHKKSAANTPAEIPILLKFRRSHYHYKTAQSVWYLNKTRSTKSSLRFFHFSHDKPHVNGVTGCFTFIMYDVIYFSILGFYCMTSTPVRVSTWGGMCTWGWPTWCTSWIIASPGSSFSRPGSGCGTGSHVKSNRTDWNGRSSSTWTASVNTCPWLNWRTISKVSYHSRTISKVCPNWRTVSKVDCAKSMSS